MYAPRLTGKSTTLPSTPNMNVVITGAAGSQDFIREYAHENPQAVTLALQPVR